jgi:hypothetical protein
MSNINGFNNLNGDNHINRRQQLNYSSRNQMSMLGISTEDL